MAQTTLKAVLADVHALRAQGTFADGIAGNIAVIANGIPGVTLAGTPGQSKSITVGPLTISGIPLGDNGQSSTVSIVRTTGVYEGLVTGASSSTDGGTKVYLKDDGELTLTSSGATYFGRIAKLDGFVHKSTTHVLVKIGDPA